jgi:AIPR protein
MAKNDAILLNGIIDQRLAQLLPSDRRDEVFEYFAIEQYLKDYDLSREELESGWVDGRNDGGIDGLYIFVNGHLLRDPQNFVWPKRQPELSVYILTCKHHDTFEQQPLDGLLASLSELLDLSKEKMELKGAYSSALLHSRDLFHRAYSKLAADRPTLKLRCAYLSRGDTAIVGESVRARANQIIDLVHSLFSSSENKFDFIGAAELVVLYRRTKKFSLELPVLEQLSHEASGYVVLASLNDYARFVTDDAGSLRRYLFDSNVRDYVGSTQVNEDILASLNEKSGPDFWWLNNGVTILATSATMVGKTLHLDDIQIVNGLQTTESIFRHRREVGAATDQRSLLVKIIVSTDPLHRDRIIQATNNQNIVEIAALRATDKVQRDIEEYLNGFDWYYERRKNYYRNVGKPAARFVLPLYLAAGYVALVMKSPTKAATLKNRFMRNDEAYEKVFSNSTPLRVWLVITEVLKWTEQQLELRRRNAGNTDRFLKTWRNLVGFLCVAKMMGRFSYSAQNLAEFEPSTLSPLVATEIWDMIQRLVGPSLGSKPHKKIHFALRCCEKASLDFGIAGIECVEKQQLPGGFRAKDARTVDDAFINAVDALLPQQPWKPGVRDAIAKKLQCSSGKVFIAIGELIKRGRRYSQSDGVVYAADGTIIAKDPERAGK